MSTGDVETVWAFWFGDLDATGAADATHTARWWKKDAAFDAEIRDRFLSLHGAVARGEHEAWRADARGLAAYVVVLDQLSRNMFRDTPGMFAQDARALAAAKEGIAAGYDRDLPFAARSFVFMPFMHAESLADQDASVELFTRLVASSPEELRERRSGQIEFAEKHRVIIRRFGRFPHRNAILGRRSTAEELEFLTQPGSSF